MVQDNVDWHDHGRHIRWRNSRMLARNVEQRRQYVDKSAQFIDFPMERIVRDPMACVQEIYKHFDIELTEQTYQKMASRHYGLRCTPLA